MVLIVVMIVIVIVSLAGFAFAALMFTERKAVQLYGDELQLHAAVGSGEELLKSLLAKPPAARDEAGGIDDNPDKLRGVLVFQSEDAQRQARFSVVSPRIDNDEVTGIRFGLQDESSRLNLAVLPEWERRQPGSAKQALLRLPGMTESAADSILDWIDADSEPRAQGAEDDYYSGLEATYAARNSAPESLEELLLVKDVAREQLFGADTNRNYVVDEFERQAPTNNVLSAKNAAATTPWATFLTSFSAERNLRSDGTRRINLNDGNLARLSQSLTEALDARWARFIVAYRQNGAYTGSAAGTPDSGTALDVSRPPKVRIDSVYDLVGARVEIPSTSANGSPTVLASPIRDDRDAMRRELPKLLDCTTVVDTSVIYGRVAVNSATKTVLTAVPGLDDALAEQIVSARSAQIGTKRPETRHACWLLTDGLVDVKKMKALDPYLTAEGDVFRGQIVGFWDHPAPAARMEIVVDASTAPPRVMSRQDLRLLGPAFTPEELGAAVDELAAQRTSAVKTSQKHTPSVSKKSGD
jgi:DNA uptake protein ComE-like DNA-binding protein